MGEQSDSLTGASSGQQLLKELVAGLDPATAWTGADDELPAFATAPVWEIWGMAGLVIAGTILMVWAGWKWWLLRRRLRHWPELDQFAKGSGNREAVETELRMIELIASLGDPEARKLPSMWNKLTLSEQVVAWGTMQERSVKDLAEELACTTSHVYNLRASIRKKWELDSNESLGQAIRTRHNELRPVQHNTSMPRMTENTIEPSRVRPFAKKGDLSAGSF